MKEGIHPNYEQTTIKCACGNVIETGSTKKDIRVEVCSKCHPASRRWWILADASAASTRSSAWTRSKFVCKSPYRFRYGLFCIGRIPAAGAA